MKTGTVTNKSVHKFTILVKYPEGPIIDLFVERIVSGEWKDTCQPKDILE